MEPPSAPKRESAGFMARIHFKDIELRQLPAASTQTIQYTFSLTNLAGEIIWTKAFEIKKKA